MGSVLIEEELQFDFSKAISATHFDDEHHKMAHCMKAVDFLVEWEKEFWLVEVKDPSSSQIPKKYRPRKLREFIDKMKNQTLFAHELAPKLKDTFLYLYLQKRLPQKKIKYVVLIAIESLDPAMLVNSIDHLKRYTCFMGPDNSHWSENYIDAVAIFNEKTWNEKLGKCPMNRRKY